MAAAQTPAPPITGEQKLITVGLMAALAVAALDSTVVGTAMPTIIGQLGGLSEYAWVFSAYLLASTTTVPLYSRLADIHGRKPVFLLGLGLFVVGSALCGLASSMWMLIAFRTLQGLGAGAVQPISFTIAGDIFEPRQRARMQGFFSGVWGVSAIVGHRWGVAAWTGSLPGSSWFVLCRGGLSQSRGDPGHDAASIACGGPAATLGTGFAASGPTGSGDSSERGSA